MTPAYEMDLRTGRRTASARNSSQRPESMLQRTSTTRPASQRARTRTRNISRPETAVSAQVHDHRRTPSGTPAPIQSCALHQSIEQPESIHDDDNLDHIILACDKSRKNTIGCAYYVARDGILYCMQDITNAEGQVFEICEYVSATSTSINAWQ